MARPDQPRPALRASAVAVPPKHWFTRASDASPWRLGLPALAGCGSLPRPIGLRCSQSQPPRQTGRSDLCSRHQNGSADHSSCFVIRVTQLCRISQCCRKLTRGSRPVALAATHAPSDLSLAVVPSMQRVLWHAVCAHLCQIARKQSKRAHSHSVDCWCRVELFMCSCVLASDTLSAQAGQGAVTRD